MTEQEQLIDALESVERYLRNQELSEIGMQVKGKVLEALNRVNKISSNYMLCEEKSFHPCEHCGTWKMCRKEQKCYVEYKAKKK